MKSDFYLGAKNTLPIALTTMIFGLSVGMEAHSIRFSFMELFLMSALVFAGSAQIVVLKLLATSESLFAIGLATLFINIRLIPMGFVLADLFTNISKRRFFFSLFLIGDSSWAVTLAHRRTRPTTHSFFLGSGITAYASWILSTLAGFSLGSVFPSAHSSGLDFAMTAIFLHLIVGAWKSQRAWLPWIVAGTSSVIAAKLLPGTWHILIGSILGAACGYFAKGRKSKNVHS